MLGFMRAKMGSIRAVACLGLSLVGAISRAEYTSIECGADRLLIGDGLGGLTVADLSGRPMATYRGTGNDGPTRTSLDMDGLPFWITAKGTELLSVAVLPGQIKRWRLPDLAMERPIQRLSRWRDYVVLHSANEVRFFDPKFATVHYTGDVLPLEVAREARQGVSTTFWGERGGLFVTMRRYGIKREHAGLGEVQEMGLLSAWHCSPGSGWRYLGAFSCAVSRFQTDSGPRVEIRQGDKQFSADFGTADLGNVKVVAEGIVAADAKDIIRVPFMKSSWLPDRLRTPIEPRYTASMVVGANAAWWLEDGKVVGSSLEDGETDVYLRTGTGTEKPIAVAASEARLYVLYGDRVDVIRDGEGYESTGWIRYEAGSSAAVARSRKHKTVLASARKVTAAGKQGAIALYRKAGVSAKRITAAMKSSAQTRELELGDLIESGGQFAVYVGNGRVQPLGKGKAQEDLELAADAIAYRIIDTPNVAPPTSIAARAKLGDLILLGVNRPNPALGHDAYVRVTSGTEFDRPYLERHYHLQQAMQEYLGTPYAWGGNSHNGIDCSGFVCAVFREVGIRLPRHSRDIAHADVGEVVQDTLRYGDVLYYPGEVGRRHVAIYIGDGRTIEARSHGVDYHTVKHRRATIARRFITE
ncbi:MAG: hypothetical protein HONBIEJF_00128 [Fimbriimonadaceae bacterium]|nr:hypothetical protein [Fimbriimonadaceae bacterium]